LSQQPPGDQLTPEALTAGASTGFNGALGLVFDAVSPERVVARLRIGPQHLQPYGVVHGGVYASVAETLASIGAALAAARQEPGSGAVGLENHTTFLRTARAGTEVVAEALPQHAGRRTQSWHVAMRDAAGGRELAVASVRLMVVRPDSI
jgi:uncharacterized protein (TIGR00369 family)